MIPFWGRWSSTGYEDASSPRARVLKLKPSTRRNHGWEGEDVVVVREFHASILGEGRAIANPQVPREASSPQNTPQRVKRVFGAMMLRYRPYDFWPERQDEPARRAVRHRLSCDPAPTAITSCSSLFRCPCWRTERNRRRDRGRRTSRLAQRSTMPTEHPSSTARRSRMRSPCLVKLARFAWLPLPKAGR